VSIDYNYTHFTPRCFCAASSGKNPAVCVVWRCVPITRSELCCSCLSSRFTDWSSWLVHWSRSSRSLLRARSCHIRHQDTGVTLPRTIRHLGRPVYVCKHLRHLGQLSRPYLRDR